MSNVYKKKVLFVIDGMNVGGTQEHVYNFILQFPEYHVTIISLYGENFYKSRLDALSNVRVEHVSNARGTNRKRLIFWTPYIAIKFFAMRKKFVDNYDFVDLRLPFALLLWTIVGLCRSTPCYYNVDCDARQLTWYEKLVFRFCLPRLPYVGIDKNLRMGYRFVPLRPERLLDGEIFTSHRVSNNPVEYENGYNLLFVGRLVEYKDPLTAVKLAERYNRKYEERVDLHIIGDGPLREIIEGYCREKRLDYVHFYGYLPNVEDFYVNSTGLIKTSIGEPINSVVREMLLLGKKVFSTLESPADRNMALNDLLFEIDRSDLDRAAEILNQELSRVGPSQTKSATAINLFDNQTAIDYYKQLINRYIDLPPI